MFWKFVCKFFPFLFLIFHFVIVNVTSMQTRNNRQQLMMKKADKMKSKLTFLLVFILLEWTEMKRREKMLCFNDNK